MIDLGTGNNNKINWPMEDKQEIFRLASWIIKRAVNDNFSNRFKNQEKYENQHYYMWTSSVLPSSRYFESLKISLISVLLD